ncbi:MAG: transposase, partial [Patescibacteria group bacterium]
MYDITRLIPQTQFDRLMELLPDPKSKKRGRKRCDKASLLSGILQVMVLGIPWYQIFDCGCSFMSCYRYFKELQRRGLFKKYFLKLSKVKTNVIECASDTNTIKSYRFKSEVGWDGKHKVNGTKISLLTDINGLPADVIIESAKIHDGVFCDQHLQNTRGRRKRILNLDKLYTSADRRRKCRQSGIKVNMETKKGDYTRKRG